MTSIRDTVVESDASRDAILEILAWESEAYKISYELTDEDISVRSTALNDCAARLDELSQRISYIPADMASNEGRTAKAGKDYISMLADATSDLKAIFEYQAQMSVALAPLLSWSENAEEDPEDYSIYADSAIAAVSETIDLMAQISPPRYMLAIDGDLRKHINEFNEIFEELATAVSLSDPLRLNSCLSSLDRIKINFERVRRLLNNDAHLQFDRVMVRMNGAIAMLRYELETNINKML